MPRPRRPSAPMLVALVALFVALGGPAQASRFINGTLLRKGSVTSKQVKDHSLATRDLSKKAVRRLERTPRGSVNEVALRNDAVTPGKLAVGAVGSRAIADRAVQGGDIGLGAVGSLEVADGSLTGADVADGSLDSRDFARFWGRFSIRLGQKPDGSASPINQGACWQGDPVGLAPERAGQDIRGDVIVVTPSTGWPDVAAPGALTFSARASVSATPGRITLTVCNMSNSTMQPVPVTFNYIVLHVP